MMIRFRSLTSQINRLQRLEINHGLLMSKFNTLEKDHKEMKLFFDRYKRLEQDHEQMKSRLYRYQRIENIFDKGIYYVTNGTLVIFGTFVVTNLSIYVIDNLR